MNVTIREAVEGDGPLILEYIRALAEFEGLTDAVTVTEETLRGDLFGRGLAKALLVEVQGQSAGFAMYYFTYSTFAGKPNLYLEDLFIKPEFRHRGLARAVFQRVAETAAREGCRRLEWSVLRWNTEAKAFYASLGATLRPDWENWRLDIPATQL